MIKLISNILLNKAVISMAVGIDKKHNVQNKPLYNIIRLYMYIYVNAANY